MPREQSRRSGSRRDLPFPSPRNAGPHAPFLSPRSAGFNFTSAMRDLCGDMARRLPELRHIDLARVAIGFCQSRRNVAHGLQASLTPLRFAGGASQGVLSGRRYACQRVVDASGREYLYILNFYLPRFLNHTFEEKLSTVLHELWHISPEFDGDLRRHDGRCYAHGPSQGAYDAQMDELARRWLALDPPHGLYRFLERSFGELEAEFGGVVGTRIATPRLLRVNRGR